MDTRSVIATVIGVIIAFLTLALNFYLKIIKPWWRNNIRKRKYVSPKYVGQPISLLRNEKEIESNIFPFSSEKQIDIFRVDVIKTKTLGTSDTEFPYIDSERFKDVSNILRTNNFFHIWGMSGRGKTFFVLELAKYLLKNKVFRKIYYYLPGYISDEDFNLLEQAKQLTKDFKIKNKKKNLFIIDDAHLIKYELIKDTLRRFERNWSFFIISRSFQRKLNQFLHKRELFLDFEEVGDEYFTEIYKNFCGQHRIRFSFEALEKLKEFCEGTNLVFLTHNLNAWKSVPKDLENGVPSDEVRDIAYENFIKYYGDDYKNPNWNYIQHVVSALFQYEIKIDANYFDQAYFAKRDFKEYEKEKMMYKRYLSNGALERKAFYVSYDFLNSSEQKNAMLHASEFRFYLKAYGDNLEFINERKSLEKRGLDRIEFTKYVIEHYLESEPKNPEDVITGLRWNASESDKDRIYKHLYKNEKTKKYILK